MKNLIVGCTRAINHSPKPMARLKHALYEILVVRPARIQKAWVDEVQYKTRARLERAKLEQPTRAQLRKAEYLAVKTRPTSAPVAKAPSLQEKLVKKMAASQDWENIGRLLGIPAEEAQAQFAV